MCLWFAGGHPSPVTAHWVISQEPHWGLGFPPAPRGVGSVVGTMLGPDLRGTSRQEDGRALGKPPKQPKLGEALTLVLWALFTWPTPWYPPPDPEQHTIHPSHPQDYCI